MASPQQASRHTAAQVVAAIGVTSFRSEMAAAWAVVGSAYASWLEGLVEELLAAARLSEQRLARVVSGPSLGATFALRGGAVICAAICGDHP